MALRVCLQGARFTVPSLSNTTVVRLMFEQGREIPPRQRTAPTIWDDSSEPFAVHIYTLKEHEEG